jgi:hypothetical protein
VIEYNFGRENSRPNLKQTKTRGKIFPRFFVDVGPLERRAKKWVPVFRENAAKIKETRASCDYT